MAVSTVDTSTVTYATRMPFQRLSFYHNGRYWVFYGDGTNFVYRTSLDGAAWGGSTILHAGQMAAWESIVFDGTYVHYTCTTFTAGQPIYYRRGTPDAGGGITWSAVEQTAVAGSADKYADPTIAIDSAGYPFISYLRGTPAAVDCYCAKSSANDGTWTLDWDVQIKAAAPDSVFSAIVPLTATKMYIVYGEQNKVLFGKLYSAGWGGEEAVSAPSRVQDILGAFSVTSIGDDVHVAFLNDLNQDIKYVKRSWGVGWAATEEVEDTATTTSVPVISHHGDTIYVFWAASPSADHIYYRAKNGVWAARVDWLDESAQGLKRNDALSCYFESFGGALCAIWLTTPSSPYNVRHDCVLAPSPGWTGKISGITNPAKIMGIDVANIAKVKGIA